MSDLTQLGRVMRVMPKADQIPTEAEIAKTLTSIKSDHVSQNPKQEQIEIEELGNNMSEKEMEELSKIVEEHKAEQMKKNAEENKSEEKS